MSQEQILLVVLLALWEGFWTAVACWYAAKDENKQWYILFFLVTLLGIPEMIYISQQRKKSDSANE